MEIKILADGVVIRSYVFPDNVSMQSIQRCMEILQSAPKPSDILDKREYIAEILWTEDDLRDCLLEKGFADSPENVKVFKESGDLKSLGDCADQNWAVIYGAIRDNADQLTRLYPTLEEMESLLTSVVEFEEDDCVDLETARSELEEMGFNESQLLYFGFAGVEGTRPLCFSATTSSSEKPEKAAYDLLRNVVEWFFDDCCTEEDARSELEEIGFDEELIDTAMA